MKQYFKVFFLVMVASVVVGACADNEVTQIYTPADDIQYFPRDNADCVAGCGNSYSPNTDFYENFASGFYNVIDKDCHQISPVLSSADVDYIGIGKEEDFGTALEITVRPAPYSLLTPVVTLYDKFGRTMMVGFTQENTRESRLELLLPKSAPVFAAVEDLNNYQQGHKSSCEEFKGLKGGKNYGYILKVNKLEGVTGVDFGKLDAGSQEKRHRGVLDKGGSAQYFYFEAPSSAKITIAVSASATANSKMQAIVSGIRLSDRSLDWIRVGAMQRANSTTLTQTDLNPIASTEAGYSRYAFVVFDYDGKGGSDFNYDLSIKIGQQ